jgi:hypothetical protein
MSDTQVPAATVADEKVHPPKKVRVTVDEKHREVRPGSWLVSDFKREVKVPPEKALDQAIDGQFKPLDDGDTIEIRGGEVFVSHARQGGSA